MKKDDWRFAMWESAGTIAGIVLALCFLGLLASCRTQKEVSEEQTIKREALELIDGFNIAEYLLNNTAITWGKDSINTHTRIYVRTYDTSEADHPLLQEIEFSSEQIQTTETESVNESREEHKDSTAVNIEAVLNDSVSQKVRTSKKKGADRVIGFEVCLLLAACFAMIVGAVFAYFKKFRR